MPLKTWLLFGLLIVYATPAVAAPCETLASLSLPNIKITLAQTVPAGQFTPPQGVRPVPVFKELPAFCRIAATLTPSSDSDIKIEVWMPSAGWNNMLRPTGNGGWAGSIGFAEMANHVREGYATAGTDTGHTGFTGSFLIGHPEKAIDYGYRAYHEMTVAAKAAIGAFYGSGPKLSVIAQAGGGGRQAVSEAQRYPEDYDLIAVTGTLDAHKTSYHFGQIGVYQAAHKTPESFIPPEKLPALHQLALSKCDDRADGVKDGIIDDPLSCKVDPKEIECKGADAPTCLTPAQVETARTIYSPVTNPRTGQFITHPLLPGSELGWDDQAGPEPVPNAIEFFQWAVFQDPNWNYKTRPVNFDGDYARANTPEMTGFLNATNPDLSKFIDRGGKLLIVGGWADSGTNSGGSIDYYKAVVEKMGAARVRNAVRLFMVPGMGHIMGRNGPNNFDFDSIEVLLNWKESGIAPDQIVANHYKDGKQVGTRLICAYPQVAVHKGTGSSTDAANFACRDIR